MDPKTLQRILERISASNAQLNAQRPFSPLVLNKIRDQFAIEMTYHSNAIEGNRLTLKETMLVLREGVTVKGRNLQEHLEAKNHEEAMFFLFELADQKKRTEISHLVIRQLHQLVVKDTEKSIAGNYRNTNVRILGSKHKPPMGYQVKERMEELLKKIKKEKNNFHPVEFAARIHHEFVAIHPFEDGNGRAGRLLMNLLLLRAGYPIAIILKNDRLKYYKALEMADQGKFEKLTHLIAQAVERSIVIYSNALTRTSAQQEDVVLSKLAKQTEFSSKYLNLLARKGLLRAHKEGRNWYSSLSAVEEYKKSRLRKR